MGTLEATQSQPLAGGQLRKITRTGKAVNYDIRAQDIALLTAHKAANLQNFPRIGILILSYNASGLLKSTVERIPLGLKGIIDEIFIFDDASTDDTFTVAAELQATSPWEKALRIFKNPKNVGYGGNQKIGFRYAIERGLDYVVMLHGDGQYAPEHLPELLAAAAVQQNQIVFGSRMLNKMDALKGGMPIYKWLGNQLLTKLQNLLLGFQLAEYHTGYRVYATDVLKRIPFEENTNDFHFDSEIIVQIRALGAKIFEVPIKAFYGNEVCHVNGFKYARDVIWSALDYRLHQLHIVRRSRYVIAQASSYTRKHSPFSSHEQILKMVNKPGRALDLGSSNGLLTGSLNAKGVVSIGVDMMPPELVLAKFERYEQHNLEDVTTLNFSREFDFIIMADIVEHIRNAPALLCKIRRFLKEDGRIIISVPNIAVWIYRLSLLLGRFNYSPKGTLDETHVRFYTLDTIKQLVERAGYRITNVKFTGLPFEVLFESTGKSKLVRAIDTIYYWFVKSWPRIFSYQIVLEAEIALFESQHNDGKIGLPKQYHEM